MATCPVLFVGGSEDGLRVVIDMDDQTAALEIVNAARTNDDGYGMHKIEIGPDKQHLDTFHVYAPEGETTGFIFRKLLAGYCREKSRSCVGKIIQVENIGTDLV